MSGAITAALIGLAGAGLGAYGASQQAGAASQAANANVDATTQQGVVGLMQALLQNRMNQSTQTTPLVTTSYNPRTGWKTVPTQAAQRQIGMSLGEENARLQSDIPAQRFERQQMQDTRGVERTLADAMLRKIAGSQGDMPASTMLSLSRNDANSAITDAMNQQDMMTRRQLMRSGADPTAFMNASAANRINALRNSGAGSLIDAIMRSKDFNSQSNASNANFAQSMASSGGNYGDVPFNPSQLSGSFTSQMLNSANKPMAQFLPAVPNYSAANFPGFQSGTNMNNLGTLLAGISALGDSFSGSGGKQSMPDVSGPLSLQTKTF